MDWTAGYAADIEYVAGFHRDHGPAYLNFVCVANGFEPVRIDRPFTYCELGFGRGLTIDVLAATNPQGRFFGVDFNPAHVNGARRLADAAGLSNVTLLENSFEELFDRNLDLPPFDFIVLHGVYAWVSAQNRQHLRRFLRDFLKPGGIAYVSYNAMPGWTSALPLQRLIREHAALHSGRSDARLTEARAFVNRMVELKAAYFANNPTLAARLGDLASGLPQYLVHEYLNAHFEPMYHADVARQLFDDSKLQFAGSADLPLAFPALYLTQETQQLLATVPDAATAETVKDYFLDTSFRKDVYTRGARPLGRQKLIESLDQFGVALCGPREQVDPKTIKLPFGEIVARDDLHGPLLDALASRPHGFGELAALPAMQGVPPAQRVRAVSLLVATSHAMIYPTHTSADAMRTSRAMNLALTEHAGQGDDFQVLASPLLGSAIPVTFVGELVYRQLAERGAVNDAAAIAARAWEILSLQGRHLEKDGRKIESGAANIAELARLVEQVVAQRVPVWRQLGIA